MHKDRMVERDIDLMFEGESVKAEVEKIINKYFPNGIQTPLPISIPIFGDRYCHNFGDRIIISSSKDQNFKEIDRVIILFINERISDIFYKNADDKFHSLTCTAKNSYNKDGTVRYASHFVKGKYISKAKFKILKEITKKLDNEEGKVMSFIETGAIINDIIKLINLGSEELEFD